MPRKEVSKYIRNIRHVPVGIRLGTGRRIELKPRGERGDCAPVQPDEMQDEIFLGNVDLLFEVISTADAKSVISKQTTNQQSVHPALAAMRSPLGEPYTKGVVVEESNEDQGKVVAAVTERGMITRMKAHGSIDNPIVEIPSDVPPEQVSDWVARQKHIEGPEAGLAGQKIVKAPVQKSD